MQRTDQQNRALHLWLRQVAQALCDLDEPFDFRDIRIEIDPTEDLVKKYMWVPVQKALYDKEHTSDLEKMEVSNVYEHLNRLLADRFGIHVPWPEDKGGEN